MKITIFGYGVVGQALHSIINPNTYLQIVDPIHFKDYEIEPTDIAFICVSANNFKDDSQDITNIIDALKKSKSYLNVIKSTILPENVDYLIELFPDKNIIINPEFLTEIDSFDTIKNEKICVIGANKYVDAQLLIEFYKNCNVKYEKYEVCKPNEAMLFKYIRNCFGALKVTFWNIINQKYNTRKVAKIFNEYERLNPQGLMSTIALDGKPGFGGKCFPKDMKAFNKVLNSDVFTEILDFNSKIRDE